MKKKLIFWMMIFSGVILYAQNSQKYKLINLTKDENQGYTANQSDIRKLLIDAVRLKKIKAFAYTGKFADFSKPLTDMEFDKLRIIYSAALEDSIFLRDSEWQIELQTENNEIRAVTFYIFLSEMTSPSIFLIKYSDAKAYLDEVYKASLKFQKIDHLKAVWFDLKNPGRISPLTEALEKEYYLAKENKKPGNYPKREDEICYECKLYTKPQVFYLNTSSNEKQTVVWRQLDFRIWGYPYFNLSHPFAKLSWRNLRDSLSAAFALDKTDCGLPSTIDYLDTTQNYQPNRAWRIKAGNFFHHLFNGLMLGEIKLYTSQHASVLPDDLNSPLDPSYLIEEIRKKGEKEINIEDLSLLWKEYLYADVNNKPVRSEIEYLYLLIPQGITPTSKLGDIFLGMMKFAEVKAYFEKIFKNSQGRLGSINGLCMTTALEKHQHFTSMPKAYFNPFEISVRGFVNYLYPERNATDKDKLNVLNQLQNSFGDYKNTADKVVSQKLVEEFDQLALASSLKITNSSGSKINIKDPIPVPSRLGVIVELDSKYSAYSPDSKYLIEEFIVYQFHEGASMASRFIKGNMIDFSKFITSPGDSFMVVLPYITEIKPNGEKKKITCNDSVQTSVTVR